MGTVTATGMVEEVELLEVVASSGTEVPAAAGIDLDKEEKDPAWMVDEAEETGLEMLAAAWVIVTDVLLETAWVEEAEALELNETMAELDAEDELNTAAEEEDEVVDKVKDSAWIVDEVGKTWLELLVAAWADESAALLEMASVEVAETLELEETMSDELGAEDEVETAVDEEAEALELDETMSDELDSEDEVETAEEEEDVMAEAEEDSAWMVDEADETWLELVATASVDEAEALLEVAGVEVAEALVLEESMSDELDSEGGVETAAEEEDDVANEEVEEAVEMEEEEEAVEAEEVEAWMEVEEDDLFSSLSEESCPSSWSLEAVEAGEAVAWVEVAEAVGVAEDDLFSSLSEESCPSSCSLEAVEAGEAVAWVEVAEAVGVAEDDLFSSLSEESCPSSCSLEAVETEEAEAWMEVAEAVRLEEDDLFSSLSEESCSPSCSLSEEAVEVVEDEAWVEVEGEEEAVEAEEEVEAEVVAIHGDVVNGWKYCRPPGEVKASAHTWNSKKPEEVWIMNGLNVGHVTSADDSEAMEARATRVDLKKSMFFPT
ncbi:hypothetical protein HDU98_006229 [Podochytrium sp. JEL0797]|nr:hypothetical protein HDU98_006229 [Podochytrium sp. JEL0797]